MNAIISAWSAQCSCSNPWGQEEVEPQIETIDKETARAVMAIVDGPSAKDFAVELDHD